MQFTKMHGLGNNYIFFNLLETSMGEQDFAKLSKKVSNVNFGIGSDGIILIGSSDVADFQMRIFNADGSEGRNCGNGLRCVAKYLFDHMYAATRDFTIETLGGVVRVEVEVDKRQIVRYVTVDMGTPKLLKGMIPMAGNPSSTAINEPISIGAKLFHMTCVSMGNPHAIQFVDDIEDYPLSTNGPIIEHSNLFPERVNVGIVTVRNRNELNYRVWERGSGITMACGTGACAAVVAATLNDMIDKYIPITVHLPGGDLTVSWDEHDHVWMRGQAEYICHGELVMEEIN
ncbi:diaminopimelate epimerase [Fredinandcohnia quinoae]|uniref:Diaminopimelate epimerase n=1 Tax=Fredinandcohnia quinoae TaxID=2918902 RepID=A0AAW5DW52_9BACI|nr:diaminopimelate epimerase [Fredinandcohnia sp. SECRCQ15]MCH1624578.1 diaminopimelate epimerase [Fredinandcohnia sp. SECRCQ15]